MPNWVSNTLVVTGDKHDVRAFVDQAAQAHEDPFGGTRQSALSFWNFVKPSDLEFYKDNWYEWNIESWGCKWDAGDVTTDSTDIDNGYVNYSFETPWGQPREFFEAIVEQFPDLDFNLRFVEEQGWGGEYGGSGGQFHKIAEWDIPETHEERITHIGYCYCDEMRDDEIEWMYDDCPRKAALAHA
jgi:hypothetical protein